MRVLVVCTGNTCRSPLAEAIVRRLAASAGRDDIAVSSAGTNAWEGAPPTDEAMLVAMERGLDLSQHLSRRLTRELLEESDLVLAMSSSHVTAVRALKSDANVHLLAGYCSENEARSIPDPFGGDLAAYRETADDLEQELAALLEHVDRE